MTVRCSTSIREKGKVAAEISVVLRDKATVSLCFNDVLPNTEIWDAFYQAYSNGEYAMYNIEKGKVTTQHRCLLFALNREGGTMELMLDSSEAKKWIDSVVRLANEISQKEKIENALTQRIGSWLGTSRSKVYQDFSEYDTLVQVIQENPNTFTLRYSNASYVDKPWKDSNTVVKYTLLS